MIVIVLVKSFSPVAKEEALFIDELFIIVVMMFI